MFNLTDQNLTALAMEYDPAPVLQMLEQSALATPAGGNFLTMPGPTQGPGLSYADIVQGAVQDANKPKAKIAAGLDPATLAAIDRMMPREPARAPAAAPQRFGPVQLSAIAQGMPQAQRPLSLAQILGVR